MTTASEIKAVAFEQIVMNLQDDGVESPKFTGRDRLVKIGVSSLVLARLIISLEGELGVNPFQDGVRTVDVQTVDDLVSVYVRALRENDAA